MSPNIFCPFDPFFFFSVSNYAFIDNFEKKEETNTTGCSFSIFLFFEKPEENATDFP
jgi:hypothetical protein